MNSLKKILAVVLALVMVLAMAACGKDDTTTTPKQDTQKNDDGTIQIRVYRACFNTTPDDAKTKQVEDAVNAKLAELKANVRITLKDVSSGEYTDKAKLALTAGEIDLLWTASWESSIGTNDLVPQGASYDITNLLPGTTLYSSLAAPQWESAKYAGKNYFIPVYKDNVEGYDYMIRDDLVESLSIDTSAFKKGDLRSLETALEAIKNAGVKYPFLTQKTALFYRLYLDKFDFFTADSASNFVAVDRASNTVVNTLQTAEYKEFVTIMAEWVEKGYVSADDGNKVTTDTTTQTQEWGISWWTDLPSNAEASNRYGQAVSMAPATDRYAHSTSALGSCYTIYSGVSEDTAKACIEFMGLLYTNSDLADIYTFGIEGEDFNYVTSEGGVKKVKKVDGAKYNHSMWESANATVVTPEDGEPDNKAELYDAFNGGANTSCAAGFRFDKTPVEAQFTACQTVNNEYGFALEHGIAGASSDIDSLIAEYQAALDDAGYQDVLKEFQTQYENWKAGK